MCYKDLQAMLKTVTFTGSSFTLMEMDNLKKTWLVQKRIVTHQANPIQTRTRMISH